MLIPIPTRFLKPCLVLFGVAVLFLGTACSKKQARITKVTVAGEAIAKVEPDVAVLVLSVVTQSGQAITAQQENARKSEAVAKAIQATAGSNAEIKTSDYSLQPQYDYRNNRLPKIIGYDARNSVIVTMSDLKNVGAIVDAASRAGANSVDRVSFVLRQTSPVRGQALADATQQAMNKAQSIAQALGGRVLRVVEEHEEAAAANVSQMNYEAAIDSEARMATKPTTPIEAGQLSIRSNVQLIVEVES
jgi:uncharacterized protein YggE